MKITVGVFSGITMLTADGLHGVADSTTSIATWLGLFLSKRKPTGRFPYGYYKAENLASLLVSVLILYTAYEVLLEGFEKSSSLSLCLCPSKPLPWLRFRP